MMKRLIFIILFLTIGKIYSQSSIHSYFSLGYMQHHNYNGANAEIGVDFDVIKQLNLSLYLRSAFTVNEFSEQNLFLYNIGTNISWNIINTERNRLMIGPGLHYGYYEKNANYSKDYWKLTIDYLKIRYEYKFNNNFTLGPVFSLYGDDRDGSSYFVLNIGYKF